MRIPHKAPWSCHAGSPPEGAPLVLQRPLAAHAFLALLSALPLLIAPPAGAGEARDLQYEPKLVLYGKHAGDAFGSALAAGDLDGDGIEDLAVGAPASSGADGSPAAGRVFLYYGSPSIVIAPERSPAPDAVFLGMEAGEQIGLRLAAGDIDGDGREDLVIGSMAAGGPEGKRPSGGEALVFFGRPREDLPASIDFAAVSPDITIYGAGRNDHLAGELAMGDFDGDGLQDLAIGAFYGDGPNEERWHAGEVSILFGGDRSTFPRVIDLAETKLPTIYGPEAEDTFGRGIAAGDIDGDGRDDLIGGAYYGDGPENDRIHAGETFIVFGDDRDRFPESIDLATEPPVLIAGESEHDLSGRSVGAADIDGDGIADLFIGAHRAAADPPSALSDSYGAVYVIFGKPRCDWPRRIDLRTDADLRLHGEDAEDCLGFPLRGVRWENGAGAALAVARESAGGSVGRNGAGEAYLIGGRARTAYPRSGPIGGAADLELVGPDEGDRIGEDACVLDWNADGRLDIALGAPDGGGPRNQAPRTGEVVIWSSR